MRGTLFAIAGICVLLGANRDVSRAQEPQQESAIASFLDPVTAIEHPVPGNNFYVDCSSSGTNADGRSPATAWNALSAVNDHTFGPGNVVHLKRGTECHGSLWPKGSGTAAASIRLTAYGDGDRPKIIAAKGDEEAFKLFNQEYWDVDSIEFSGGTVFGVYVSGDQGILHHIHVRNLLVHDVHGSDVKHKESGLVVISPGTVHQHFDDVLVEGVTAYDTEQWAGILVGGGNFGEVAEEDWSTHVTVRNSTVHNVYGDGIILFRVKYGMIEDSSAWYIGMQPTQSIGTPDAIWTWMCTDCAVKKNEAFLTDSPGVDGGAFDIDYGNTRDLVIDNYAHDTQGYCVSVFAAGYVTHDSVVEGNLCVNNGRSPRMAPYQGAIFLYTWNDGVIENVRVERNIVYWNPPGHFPAILNRGDIRGTQRVFQDNEIYSAAPSMIESNKNIEFQNNQYVSCGTEKAKWTYDGRTYDTFNRYQRGSNQDEKGTWKSDLQLNSCLDSVPAKGATSAEWTVDTEIPASIDEQGLLDTASASQLLVLKNLYMQFRPSGLRLKVRLNFGRRGIDESVRNAIRDLLMTGVEPLASHADSSSLRPTMRFLAPDGSPAKEWKEFVGPAGIGLVVRQALGAPLFAQMQ